MNDDDAMENNKVKWSYYNLMRKPVNVCKLFSIQNDIEWEKLFVVNIYYTFAYIRQKLYVCVYCIYIYVYIIMNDLFTQSVHLPPKKTYSYILRLDIFVYLICIHKIIFIQLRGGWALSNTDNFIVIYLFIYIHTHTHSF